MKRVLLTIVAFILLFSGVVIPGESQPYVNAPYGNEWINYNQPYYKITTADSGFYKLSYSDLEQKGLPVNQVNPQNFHLYHRGREQAIIVNGE